MNKQDLVRKFLSENKNKSKRGIARILYEQNPKLWKSIEDARTAVRYVTGSAGELKRREVADPEKRKFFYSGYDTWSNSNLDTEIKTWEQPFHIPAHSSLNIIADLHSINLDHKALEQFVKTTTDKSAVLINGDLLDSESLSRHLKGNNVIPYEQELEICHQILVGLKQEFNQVYFHAGNHDYWLERYLLMNAREIFKLNGLTIKELLKLDSIGVHYVPQLSYMTYLDIDILHGHQFNGFGGGKFPATSLLDKWQTFKKRYDVKVLASHSHKFDYAVSKKSKDGKFGQSWVSPAMCRKSASYNPFAGWDTGWIVLNNKEGSADVKEYLV